VTPVNANPEPILNILNPADLEKARARERLRVIHAIIGLGISVLVFLFWVYGGLSVALRDATGGDGTLLSRIAFIAAFSLIVALVDAPFEVYFGYSLGKRFGLLKQNFTGWLADQLKEAAVGGVLSIGLFLGLYTIFRAFPNAWFPVSLGFITVVFGLALWLSPRLARLRFKSAPLDNPELESRVQGLFKRANVPLLRVSRWLFGEKTKQGNAALVPVGTGSEVLISDTLMESVSADGIEVVLAHELGHRVHKDIPRMLVLSWVQFALILLVAYGLLNTLGSSLGMRGPTDIATLPVFVFAFTVVGSLFSLITNEVTRRAEYKADLFALEMTRNPHAFEETFRALARDNLSDPDPPAWVEFWLHDHPSIEKRIRAARLWTQAKT
jgi:STE24 endopeptidase